MKTLYSNRKKFSRNVERMFYANVGNITFVDAVISCAKTQGIEPEQAAKLLNEKVLDRIETEATKYNLLSPE
jgi:NAD/NADP transhydrogenase beta subunit